MMLNNLSNKNETDLKIDFKKNQFIIQGFSWELGCLFDNMFLKKDDFVTVFTNKNFYQEILNKRNFLNFGNAYGRSGFRPLVTGKNFDRLAKQLINI